jgi:uncharacterized tellurite resistance protein B-like protein
MLERIKDLFRSDQREQEEVDPALAAAALMFEVVWADHDVAPAELAAMSGLLQQLFRISPERLEEIHQITRANHDASVGVFPFTRAINEQLKQDEKFAILKAMWKIAGADAQIDAFEEHTIRRIADLLYIPHQRFIEAKMAARSETLGGANTAQQINPKSEDH